MEINQKTNIQASPEKIWEVITENKYVQQFMFNCEIDSDWKKGSSLVYYITKDGKRTDMVSGIIKHIEPPFLLHHTLFPVGADYPDIPANHIYIIYTIRKKDTGCELEIYQGGYETVAMGEKRYEDSKDGLNYILPEIKRLAETK